MVSLLYNRQCGSLWAVFEGYCNFLHSAILMTDTTLSIVFYILSVLCFLLGFWLFLSNFQRPTYQLFFCMMFTIALSFFAAAMQTSWQSFPAGLWEKVLMAARIVRRPLVLHLALLVAGRPLIAKKWSIPLIYIPALLLLVTSGFNHALTENWILGRVSGYVPLTLSAPVVLPEALLLLYALFAAALFFRQAVRGSEAKIKKELFFVAVALLISALTGPLMAAGVRIPHPVHTAGFYDHFLFLLAIAFIWLFFKLEIREAADSKKRISSSGINNRGQKVFVNKLFSYYFICSAFLHFGSSYYLKPRAFHESFTFTGYMLLIGCLIGLLEKLKISEKLKNIIPSLLVASLIPVAFLFGGSEVVFSVWLFAIIFMLFLILLGDSFSVLIPGITTVVFSMFFLIKNHFQQNLVIPPLDYFSGMIFFVLIMLLALFINKTYTARMEENQKQIQLQDLVTNIALSFTNVYAKDVNNNINKLLEVAGTFSAVERAVVWLVDGSGFSARLTHEWYREGEIPARPAFPPLYVPHFMDFYNALKRNEILELSSDFFEEYYKDKDLNPYTYLNVRSVLCIPLTADAASQKLLTSLADETEDVVKNRSFFAGTPAAYGQESSMAGFIGLTTRQYGMQWSNNHKYLLRIFASTLLNICTRAQSERTMFSMAYFDQLTGLPNRFFLAEDLEKKINKAAASGSLIGVALMDLDSFKYVNDTVGHNIGDEVLRMVSVCISKGISERDVLIRFGGDEFIVIFDQVASREDIIKRMEKIMGALEDPLSAGGQSFFITASAGVAIYPYDGEDPDTLIKNADMTMYVSKDMGKNRFSLCTDHIKDEIVSEVFLINKLNFALENNQLLLNYQPIVRIADGAIVGFEALCRWNLPDTGLIPPGQFIPLAERSSLINQIGAWVLYTACKQTKDWQDRGYLKLPVSVNFSMRQFQDVKLVKTVSDILGKSGLDPEYLIMEITESIDSRQESLVMALLKDISALGAVIVVDDFGMQYSSLNRLKSMPFSKLKIDMQFVRGITTDEKDRGVARTIIQLAKNLNLKVVAEGVETQEQLDLLREWGCDEAQGYYFHRPLPADKLEELLKTETLKKR